ncbi:MAG: endonuclease domain-containing protein [Ruminococcaceae bacterium]|nr:endonuclease domain-containing protein [Oscillospiraceae bacterium]
MDNKRNHELVGNARSLRREMTKEERHLWYDYLRQHPVKFRRQAVLGRFIVDFYCAKAKLVIELDGSQHYEPQNQQEDQLRTEYLEKFGVTVLRFANSDITRNFRGVCEYIDGIVQNRLNNCRSE